MKILHVTNYMYPNIGGIEQTSRDIVNSLLNEHEQRVICFNNGKKDVIDRLDGIEITRCATQFKISSQAISFSFKKRLKEQFKKFQPDVVIFHYPNPFQAHYLLKLLKKNSLCKLIVWWHLDITKQKLLGKLFKGQSIKLLQRAEKIIATSPNYLEGSPYLSVFKEKCIVIPSCINEKRLEITEKSIRLKDKIRSENEGKILCFAIGRHVEYKGYEYLIKASKKLDDRFVIYLGGEGKLTPKLKQLADGDDKIRFLGKISDEEVVAYMSACDIYCFPSITKNEAFGLALAEAMSFGKPAVTFTIEGSGVNYVSLDGVTGLEVENVNSIQYVNALKVLAANSALSKQYGEAAKERVEELFSQTVFMRSVKKLIAEI